MPKRQRGGAEEEEGADVEAALGRSRRAGLATAAIGFRLPPSVLSAVVGDWGAAGWADGGGTGTGAPQAQRRRPQRAGGRVRLVRWPDG